MGSRFGLCAVLGAVLAFGACGGADERAAAPAAPPSRAAGMDEVQFRALANDVCATVRRDAPGPLTADLAPKAIRSHAEASQRIARATATSLRRLPTPAALKPAVGLLAQTYAEAARDFKALAAVGPGRREALLGAQREHELVIHAAATQAGLPACAGTAR